MPTTANLPILFAQYPHRAVSRIIFAPDAFERKVARKARSAGFTPPRRQSPKHIPGRLTNPIRRRIFEFNTHFIGGMPAFKTKTPAIRQRPENEAEISRTSNVANLPTSSFAVIESFSVSVIT